MGNLKQYKQIRWNTINKYHTLKENGITRELIIDQKYPGKYVKEELKKLRNSYYTVQYMNNSRIIRVKKKGTDYTVQCKFVISDTSSEWIIKDWIKPKPEYGQKLYLIEANS